MSIISIRIPQLGEGLQEARLVAILKQAGESVKRDELIYQMETDKAVMDVESPFEGVLTEWLAQPDELLPIGAEVARISVSEAVKSDQTATTATKIESEFEVNLGGVKRAKVIPPRTRAYAREKGIADDLMGQIPAESSKLMPSDIDLYLAVPSKSATEPTYDDGSQTTKQRLLASRLVRGSQFVVPGTMTVVTRWEAIEHARAREKSAGHHFQPSAFTYFAFAVARAMIDHPAFRSTLVGEDILRTYRHISLGIAVGLPGDELVLAVVDNADTLTWQEFAEHTRERIDLARSGKDQANESVTLSLTNMQSFHLRDAVPVVVPPAVATLFLGETFVEFDPDSESGKTRRVVNMVLTFDHRVMNGVGAANFMKAIRKNVESIDHLIG